jgi:SAM-dependent methyltransferase
MPRAPRTLRRGHAACLASNRALWEEWTANHLRGSRAYPIAEFRKAGIAVRQVERAEVGSVRGKRLLHLQCHFGMDTLSWARLGATVTGVDFSPAGIAAARQLAKDIGQKATFLCCNVYDLRRHLSGRFDIVFASYGSLYWLPDLHRWAAIAASYLKRGGFVYVADGHPFRDWMEREPTVHDLRRMRRSYFDREVERWDRPKDYADLKFRARSPEYGWHHTVGDIINALADAGLAIDFFHEFPSFDMGGRPGAWAPLRGKQKFPVMFSVKAGKTGRHRG